MKLIPSIIFLFIYCFACNIDDKNITTNKSKHHKTTIAFNKGKWKIKNGNKYPFRDQMFHDIIYNDSIRSLNKEQLTQLLGAPDYTRTTYLYYRIKETFIGNWPIKTKTMVIKLKEGKSIDWIKIHE